MIHYINRTESHGFTESYKCSMNIETYTFFLPYFHSVLKLNIMYYYVQHNVHNHLF